MRAPCEAAAERSRGSSRTISCLWRSLARITVSTISTGRAEIVGRLDQRPQILREAGAAEARAGGEELRADAVVEADAERQLLHVGAGQLAEPRQLVDEGHLGGEEGVRRVFDELRRLHRRGDDQRPALAGQRHVELLEQLARPLRMRADDDAVRLHEIGDGVALAQELRVGGDGEALGGEVLADDRRDLAAGADRHRRLGDDHGEAMRRRVLRRRARAPPARPPR